MTPYFQRGDLKVYLGDCREFLPSLPDKCVDMLFSDLPYGHKNNDGDLIHNWEKACGKPETSASEARPIQNDGVEANELFRWLMTEMPRLLVRGGCCCCCCCCCGGGPDPQFARWSLMMDEVLDFKQMVVWDKGPMGLGWHYKRSYETVLVGAKRGGACKWYDTSLKIENIIRPGAYGIAKIIPSAEDHPTPKPPALAGLFIRLHSQVGETVLDPFMGGGSTALAAIRHGRKFIGCEIDRQWCDMACAKIDAELSSGNLFEVPADNTQLEQDVLFEGDE